LATEYSLFGYRCRCSLNMSQLGTTSQLVHRSVIYSSLTGPSQGGHKGECTSSVKKQLKHAPNRFTFIENNFFWGWEITPNRPISNIEGDTTLHPNDHGFRLYARSIGISVAT